jgi:hypothetical protein
VHRPTDPPLPDAASPTYLHRQQGPMRFSEPSSIVYQEPPQVPDYIGVPEPLVDKLIKLYFSHVYNSHLLLHEPSFMHDRSLGLIKTHVILSVCAWGAM